MKSESLESRIDACNTLSDLFSLWKNAHSRESDDSCMKTFPFRKRFSKPAYENFKDSFCPDGYTSMNGHGGWYMNPEIEILFVLPEEKLLLLNGDLMPEKGDYFWFDRMDPRKTKDRYHKAIGQVIKRLESRKLLMQHYMSSTIFGYMNLNKRGGYGSTDMKALANYVQVYQSFIRRQITIMHPRIIVCLGCYQLLKPICDAEVMLDLYHPASSGFLKRLDAVTEWL